MGFNKIKVDYHAIDYALFGSKASKVLPKNVYIEYDATKLALLDIVNDYNKLHKTNLVIESTDYSDPESVAIQEASLMHKTIAKWIKMNYAILMDSIKSTAKKLMTEGFDINTASHLALESVFAKRMLTDMLISPIITESKVNKVNKNAQQILYESYKILLNELIETALPYLSILDKGACCA